MHEEDQPIDITDDLNLEEFSKIVPMLKDHQTWYDAVVEALPQYEIYGTMRIAAFMAQCSHESAGFTVLQENLNYSKDGLRKIFPKYFPTDDVAAFYARKPQLIANRVYANRMGNGSEESGEGWKYRGRGLIQLTGKSNYTECSRFMFDDLTLLENPDLLLDPYYAIHSACWFWSKNKLNEIADRQDITLLTKRINGGTIGLQERIREYNHIYEILME